MASRKCKVSVQSGLLRPDFESIKKTSRKFESSLRYALYYAHYELTDKNLKAETVKYAKKSKLDYKMLELLDNYEFSVLGKPAYILNKGAEISEEWQKFLNNKLEELLAKGKQLKKEKDSEKIEKPKVVINIQDRLKEQASEMCEVFEQWIDNFIKDPQGFDIKKHDPHKVIVSTGMKAGHARYVIKFYENDLKEIEEVLKGKDEELLESYSTYKKSHLKKLITLYKGIIGSANMIIEAANVERKSKKKPVSAEKQVSRLKYAKSFPKLKLVSVNPTTIIGATELWVYNTKTRKLGRYIAADHLGLTVNGVSIGNFSSKSTEKTLRKPEEHIQTLKSMAKTKRQRFFNDIKAVETKLKGRTNDNCILLKVVK